LKRTKALTPSGQSLRKSEFTPQQSNFQFTAFNNTGHVVYSLLYHWLPLVTVYHPRFRPPLVKEIIHKVLKELLHEKQYSSEEAKTLSKEISEAVQLKLKGPKHVHVVATSPL